LLTRTSGTITTTYNYDNAGNLVSVIQPDGSALTNVYDAAHRLIAVTDLFNQSIAYTLDALGGRTQTSVLDASGQRQRTHAIGYDALAEYAGISAAPARPPPMPTTPTEMP